MNKCEPAPYISKVWIGRLSADSSTTSNIHECIGGHPTTAALVPIVLRAVQQLLLTQAHLLAGGLVQLTLQCPSCTKSPGRFATTLIFNLYTRVLEHLKMLQKSIVFSHLCDKTLHSPVQTVWVCHIESCFVWNSL